MISANDLRKGDAIVLDGETYLVLEANFHRAQQRKANVRTKLKNVLKGNVVEKSFSSTESLEKANISYKRAQYSYYDDTNYIFMLLDNYEQVALSDEILGENVLYIKENCEVDLQYVNGEITSVILPTCITLQVTYTEPGFKGDTTGGAMKSAELDTGLKIEVPLFIKIGDKVIVDTRNNSYVERANK